ncbi:hypothetical protein [Ruegeria atlantica]|uniref:hypothetical protein n=1 Tax=Ruegeria atlantica TaxID=81569 RepID=UPI00147A86C1|nr:hypothetical protein [Ruegeria atlantica]
MLRRILGEIVNDLPYTRLKLFQNLGRFKAWLAASRVDLGLAFMISLLVGAGYWLLASQIPQALIDPTRDAWVWFEADLIRVHPVMLDRYANNYRTNVHPLQAIIMYTPTKALIVAGLSERLAVFGVLSATAGLWSAALFGGFRGLGLPRFDAIVFTALGAVSSAAIFWMPVPEVHAFAGLTVTIALAFGTMMQRGTIPPILQSISSVIAFSMTITNWMAGILTVLASNSYKRAFRVLVDGFAIATIVFALQTVAFPRAEFFVPRLKTEFAYVLHDLAGGPFEKFRAFFAYSIAIPEVPFLDNPTFPEWMRLSVQFSPVQTVAWVGIAGLVLWAIVFIAGLSRAILNPGRNAPIAQALLLYLLFEGVLHFFYGDETFLYSMSYVPAMFLLAGFSVLGKGRMFFLASAVAVIPFLAYNNISEFLRVTSDLQAHADALLQASGAASE